MKNGWIRVVLSLAIGLFCFAAQSQQPATSSPSQAATKEKISPGTLIQVEMSSDVDAKKAHAGDIFRAKLWAEVRDGQQIILPRNAVLVGHVTEVQARTKDNPESKLTITFDKAVLRAGSELSLSGVVERVQLTPMAVAAAESTAHSYNPGLNPGSTTNIAMPSQSSASGGAGQLAASGPTNIRDSDIVARGDAGGKLTVLSSTTKTDLKLKHYATLDVRITHSAE